MELGTVDRKGINQDKTRNIPLPLEGQANPFCQSQEKNVHHLSRLCTLLQTGFIPALLSLQGAKVTRRNPRAAPSPRCSSAQAPPFVSLQ